VAHVFVSFLLASSAPVVIVDLDSREKKQSPGAPSSTSAKTSATAKDAGVPFNASLMDIGAFVMGLAREGMPPGKRFRWETLVQPAIFGAYPQTLSTTRQH